MKPFDAAPFALPKCPAGQVLFEEPRDIERVVVTFSAPVRRRGPTLQYLRNTWPQDRWEYPKNADLERPGAFGWKRMDDWFNPAWVDAAVDVAWRTRRTAVFTFKGLLAEVRDFPGADDYDVTFRRTSGIRATAPGAVVRKVQVFTRSHPARSQLRVELDAGRKTPGKSIVISGYNAIIRNIRANHGVTGSGSAVQLCPARRRSFTLDIQHMTPAHRWSGDEGLVTFTLAKETFTISMASLAAEGPIWFAEQGIYVTWASDKTTFADYRARISGEKTVAQRVAGLPEQSFAGARHGQPRPHPIPYVFGWKHARQKFWLEPDGDLVLHHWLVTRQPARDTARWRNTENGRFLFGLHRWSTTARFNDPWPVMAYNIHLRQNMIDLKQKCFAVPLHVATPGGQVAADETMVALVRFRFENTGSQPASARLSLGYSSQSRKSFNRRLERQAQQRWQDDDLVPRCPREILHVDGGRIVGEWQDQDVTRCGFYTGMRVEQNGRSICFEQELAGGQTCELLLKIPYVSIETPEELAALASLEFDEAYGRMREYWLSEGSRGARIRTPDANLNALYAGHLPIILMSDFGFPDGSELVNTSVGAATYGNYTNESCMILEELDQRGLVDEVRRRLAVWVKYQGTARLRGNFSDYDGLLFGAGGLESGDSYNQHHGWALWYLAQHYLLTGDADWFRTVAPAAVTAADWVFRQRRNTLNALTHSRGWERGFLPAGALEDVADYFYWLSTNAFTWRGVDTAARALEAFDHPEAQRIRREADAYRRDLVRGFETARQHSPLVRLRDGRWIPHYPSRLYRRGRDYGWIREVLEGSVNLLICGLYEANSKKGRWILDDYQDTRYMDPPFGYPLQDPRTEWFDAGGFSFQPCLLAGLLPYLDRDEPEVYIWMFFNALAACYREEVNAIVEHPLPVLGFSNAAPFKTSDQANAMKWLCRMFVYERDDLLHIGRAIPRQWLSGRQATAAEDVATRFGKVSVWYQADEAAGRIAAKVDLALRAPPGSILVRFRHPQALAMKAVTVDGKNWDRFDPRKGDADITGMTGSHQIVATY
jgi:hypothetical protein